MFPLVEFPELVEHYAAYFAPVFSPEGYLQFKRYISGLLVSENKTIEGINRLFIAEPRNQSSLNRWLHESPFSVEALNRQRLTLLQDVAGTRFKRNGVLSIDDTLLQHYGRNIEKIAYLYDPSTGAYVWAHDLVTLYYSDDETDYPLLFRLWEPPDLEVLERELRKLKVSLKPAKERLKTSEPEKWRKYLLGVWQRHRQQPEIEALYTSKVRLAGQLLDVWVRTHPDLLHLPVVFDAGYTYPAFCHYLDETLHLAYVGTLSGSDTILLKGFQKQSLTDFAAHLKEEHQQKVQAHQPPVFKPMTIAYKGTQEHYYSYWTTHRFPTFGKQRLVINHRQADLEDNPAFFISNRLYWQGPSITRLRRHRWSVEVYHEEGKAEGLDQYQLRDFEAITRHLALVVVVYSLLRAAQHDPKLRNKLQRQLKLDLAGSNGFWQRASQAQSLWSLALFIKAGLADGQNLLTLMSPLLQAVCQG